jgi:hypothetical protein
MLRLLVLLIISILNYNCLRAESIIVNNSTGNMTAVAGKGGIAISGGIIISGNTVFAERMTDDHKSEIKKNFEGNFSTIKIEGIPSKIFVTCGSYENSIKISAEKSALTGIDSYIDNDILRIKLNRSLATNLPINILINTNTKKIKKIVSDGNSDIYIKNLDGDIFEIKTSGSSSILAVGQVGELNIFSSGNGNLDLSNLKSERCNIIINGSGDAILNVTKILSAQINGSGKITYKGNPESVSKHVNGYGNIIHSM